MVPHNFRVPVLNAYDGSQDPDEHLAAFELQMHMSGENDAIKCKMFGGSLKGTALVWFTTQPVGSVRNFRELSEKFRVQFAAHKAKKFMACDLHDVRQKEGETLQAYLVRYNAATI